MKLSFFKIDPMHEKKEFLRKAWISLAKEDVPLKIFETDFDEVVQQDYHILCSGADYDMSWSGEIGNYRTESYIDIETYYEQEPYTEYEKTYDSNTKEYYQKPVTKYRRVEKQRQVKKDRTVTDWHSGNGEHSGKAESWECIDAGDTFNHDRYHADINTDYFVELETDELANAPDMIITDDMQARADALRRQHAERNLNYSLPGNTHRSITYRMNSYTPTYASLFRFPEYSASIKFQGVTYTKRAFAFGKMTMNKTGIPNPISVENEKKKLYKERAERIEEEYTLLKKNAWNKAMPYYLASFGMFALSILVSLFIHYLIPLFVCFIVSIVAFIFAKKKVKAVKNKANETLDEKVKELTSIYDNKVKNYDSEHMTEIFKALNKKLEALGFKGISESEFHNAKGGTQK